MNREAARDAIAAFLRALGHPPEGELAATPQLVADAWCDELLVGYASDPAEILRDGSIANRDGATAVVTLRAVRVAMICPHHLMPGHGTADLAYLPGERIAGFGAIARALHAVTRRLALQEDAGAQVARLLVEELSAKGAACRLRMAHTCLIARGSREGTTLIESLSLAGSFEHKDRDLAIGVLGP